MDLKKLASLHLGATKVVDSADLDSNDKELFDDIVKRYSGQKTLKLLKNPANGKSLESTLKDFFKKKKVGVSIKGDEVKFIKDSALKVSDSFEEWSEEEVPEELKSVYSKINEWIENGEGGFEFGEENGAVVYGEFDVDDSHEDDVRSMMEELGYEEVDTDEHHGTYYQFFKKKVKDSKDDLSWREIKVGKKYTTSVVDEEDDTPSICQVLAKDSNEMAVFHPEFTSSVDIDSIKGKSVSYYKDGSYYEEMESDVANKIEEGIIIYENKDNYPVTIYGNKVIFSEKSNVKDDSGEEQYDRGLKAGEQAREKGWDKEQTLNYYKELQKQFLEGVMKSFEKVTDSFEDLSDEEEKEFESIRGKFDEWVENGDADGYDLLKNGEEIIFEEDFVNNCHGEDVVKMMEKLGYRNTDDWSKHDSVYFSFKKKVTDSDDELERAKSYFHDDWFATNETLDFKLSDDELNELIEYVQELWDNEEMEGDYPKIEKVEDKIKVTVE